LLRIARIDPFVLFSFQGYFKNNEIDDKSLLDWDIGFHFHQRLG
jgi:hypothetical protein